MSEREDLRWRIYDFDPLRVRKLQLERARLTEGSSDSPTSSIASASRLKRPRASSDSASAVPSRDSEVDGIYLFQEETVLPAREPLLSEIRTGSEFPYMCSEKDAFADFGYRGNSSIMLLDESRLVLILVSGALSWCCGIIKKLTFSARR